MFEILAIAMYALGTIETLYTHWVLIGMTERKGLRETNHRVVWLYRGTGLGGTLLATWIMLLGFLGIAFVAQHYEYPPAAYVFLAIPSAWFACAMAHNWLKWSKWRRDG